MLHILVPGGEKCRKTEETRRIVPVKPRSLTVTLGGELIRFHVHGNGELDALKLSMNAREESFAGAPDFKLRWKAGGRQELILRVEWLATTLAMKRLRSKALILHAAWIAKGAKGVLVAGVHGSGKTTLSAALALRHGWRLMADDLTLVSRSGALRPMERPLRLKPGVRRLVPELGGQAALIPLSRFPGHGRAELRAIVLLGARKSGPLRMEELKPGIAVAKLARLAFNFEDDPAAALKRLALLREQAPACEMSGGSIGERCAAAARLL
jgi:hypothetical protein